MTRAQFDELLRRVERRYRGRPEALGRSMNAWVRLGQAGVAAWLFLLAALSGLVFAAGVILEPPGGLILLGVAIAIAIYGISQAGFFLLSDDPRHDGRALRPGEAPELVAMLDDLRREMRCRRFDEVRISTDFNAGVMEIPRLGIFGWPRTVLEIGLPLLMVLTRDELRAVLAHEFVHLSARHGRGGARVHRLHAMWASLFARLQAPGGGLGRRAAHWVASKFVGWYWPRLQARSLVLSRQYEHQADRQAAEVVGSSAMISALWRMECRGPWIVERFWPDLHKGAVDSPEPPPDVFDRLREQLRTPPSAADASRWVGRALSRRTGRDETHPAFFDRAVAVGMVEDEVLRLAFAADVPDPEAASLLGPQLDELSRELSENWRKGERAAWRERHRRAAIEARRLSSPQVDPPGGTPRVPVAIASKSRVAEVADLWISARDAADVRGLDEAVPLLRAILERTPDHAGAGVLLGHHLLGLGDLEGERLLWAVADSGDEQWTPSACRALEAHYRASGQTDRQAEARNSLDRHEGEVEAARAERASIGVSDTFLPHDLPAETLDSLRASLASHPDCEGGWLARKAIRHFPERPILVLVVRSRPGRWGFSDSERDTALVKALVPKVQLPGQVLVIARSGGFRRLARKVMALPGSRIFDVSQEIATNWDGPRPSAWELPGQVISPTGDPVERDIGS